MSESPERKVLKGTLAKLKKKTLKAQRGFCEDANSLVERFGKLFEGYEKIEELIKKEFKPLGEITGEFKLIMSMVKNSFYRFLGNTIKTFEDMNMYLSSLEQYSTELDNTLKAILDRTKEEQEKMIAELDELRKKKPMYIS